MATFSKTLLSASISGKQVPIMYSGSFPTGGVSGSMVHLCGGSPNALDEIYIYCQNNTSGTDATVLLLWGGTSSGDMMFAPVPSQNGRVLLTDGKLLMSGLSVTAFSNLSGCSFDGFVNRLS